MLPDHMGGIAETKPISLCIMCITRRHPEEFFKYFILIFLWYTDSVIFYTQFHILFISTQFNLNRGITIAVLNSIINEIENNKRILVIIANDRPSNLPFFCSSLGSLPERIEIKIILSIPSTISRIVSVNNAISAWGSVIHSI